ncbi:DUF4838 domain-containing protein [bacterium]|nr:DUF4838 domain-containing protein [bacterium]
MNIRRTAMIIVVSFYLFFLCMCAQGAVQLIQNSECLHQIVLNSGASLSEKYAARELQLHFQSCTGVKLPIIEDFPAENVPMIVLGCGELTRKLGVNPSQQELGEQGFLLQTVAPHIVIAGTREAGTLYGVHRFLEEYLGVRWYAPGVTKTPKIENLIIPSIEKLVRPAFLYRHTSYRWPGGDDDFFARMGRNAGSGDADNPHGIQYKFLGTCHSYFRYVHPNEYFETHPEYFSEIGGVRQRADTQLCLTNPDVLEIVTEKMLEFMEKNPNIRQFNFSQMDYYNYCQCSECRAMNEKYETLGGTQFWFVNELAKRTSEIYPDKLISTLAYMYTEEPPQNLEMHPNVAVWLCHMYPSCDSHTIVTCLRNSDYKRRAIEWSKTGSHLYVWHYIVDFAHYYNPFPNFRALGSDLKFYRDIGVEGLYLQGMGHGGGGGEFSLLRPYYVMKLAWNPDQDTDEIMRDFLQGYYGPAWEPIWQYIVMLHDKVEGENIHIHLYTNPAQGYLPDDIIGRATKFFDQAEDAVGDNPELLERVRVARMPLTYARLFPRNGYKIENNKLSFQGELASLTEIKEFVSRMKKHGFSAIRESYGSDPEQLLMISSLLFSQPEVVTISNEHLSVDVVPVLAGRALRIIDNNSHQCVTAYNVKRSLLFPFCGGLENRVGEQFRWYGWIEPAKIVKQTPTSIIIALQTVDGFNLERTLTLVTDKPILQVKSVLTNPSNKPKSSRLRSHLEFDLGDLRSTRVSFTNLSGRNIDKDMADIIAGLREGEYYRSQDAPNGSWTFTGSKDLKLIQRFSNDQIDYTWLYAYPEDLGELEVELWAKRAVLEPGQSVELEQEIEIYSIDLDIKN